MAYRAAVITVSDRGFRGERPDISGPTVKETLEGAGYAVVRYAVIADERAALAALLSDYADRERCDLIVTTGGTGVSPRDVTPEATRDVIDREIPGMAQAMIAASLQKTPHAMLSRAVVGIRGSCLIVNLPGSPKAARENLAVILPALGHALAKIQGDGGDCATD
ncbi:MAG: MogA/MoaB family molybdenum cofactor biosynthesis protein [Syntrophales bacterium]|nr:MogA/MoaB family molybdenum cofactor biosynthesis protein [Syntrophales bacterium]